MAMSPDFLREAMGAMHVLCKSGEHLVGLDTAFLKISLASNGFFVQNGATTALTSEVVSPTHVRARCEMAVPMWCSMEHSEVPDVEALVSLEASSVIDQDTDGGSASVQLEIMRSIVISRKTANDPGSFETLGHTAEQIHKVLNVADVEALFDQASEVLREFDAAKSATDRAASFHSMVRSMAQSAKAG